MSVATTTDSPAAIAATASTPSTSADRPCHRPYRAVVASVSRVSESFVRVVFTCPRFRWFGTDRLDQRVKLLFPLDDGTLHDLGADGEDEGEPYAWYAAWRELPEHLRSPMRTYTVRAVDPDARTVTVDFACHGDVGPATRWAQRAVAGQELLICGPDSRSETSHLGIDFKPGLAEHLLLAGDETAAPAICAILEQLPATRDVHAFIEVPTDGDVLPLDVPASFNVTWLPRNHDRVGEEVLPAVTRWLDEHPELVQAATAPRVQQLDDVDVDSEILWDSPDPTVPGEFYAWLAGESAVIKTMRRALVSARGIDRRRVAFMGYWRQGQCERSA
ncbi:siderophore-interacting protein [Litorihabitans aurantiacus]|uniref:Siderophore-interacting protein n=1 Tax=Litorihabitans aurantiacus TaxID=1930061 RepID=A0AA37UMI0_9MICO|nr:siderophore-interacting protein [Litorihabitans aurantiacus]GMA31240.1 siderophore-interacting protein [Litorihabitans aurantiacus]